jgi:hypothetical protein
MTQKEKDQKLQIIFEKASEMLDRLARPPELPKALEWQMPEIQKEVLLRSEKGIVAYSRILERAIAVFVEDGIVYIDFPDSKNIVLQGELAKAFLLRMSDDLAGPLGKRVEVIDADKL